MKWSSPVSYLAKPLTQATRYILDHLDLVYTRDSSHTAYSRFVVVIPLPEKLSYTYVFNIHHPHEFSIRYYDTKPGHSGIMSFMEIRDYDEKDLTIITEILKGLLASFQRPPWKFTFGMRLQHGLLLPEFWQSKKAWAGFDCLTLPDEERERYRKELRKLFLQEQAEREGKGSGASDGESVFSWAGDEESKTENIEKKEES